MMGKTVVITGASSGLGLETARGLAARGARIIMVVRNQAKGQAAVDEIRRDAPDAHIDVVLADLYVLAEVRRAAAEIRELTETPDARSGRVDVLVNNAGLIHDKRELTADGFERTFALNHLAAFLLSYELRDALAAAAPARIVTVSSNGHRFAHVDWADLATRDKIWPTATLVYGASKLCNIWFAREAARRLAGKRITSNAVHPGAVATGFGQSGSLVFRIGTKLAKPLLLTAEEGARTSIYCASADDVSGVTGEYFVKSKIATPSRQARDDDNAKRLWELSEQLCGVTWR